MSGRTLFGILASEEKATTTTTAEASCSVRFEKRAN